MQKNPCRVDDPLQNPIDRESYEDAVSLEDGIYPITTDDNTIISSDMVKHGSGTVADALDELNSSNSNGTITLTTTPYETEADGYIWIYMTNPNHTYSVRVRSNDDIEVAYLRGQSSIEYEYHSLYVKKGMKIVCDPQQSLTDGDTVWFKPLTD